MTQTKKQIKKEVTPIEIAGLKFYTLKDVCLLLKISPPTLRTYIRSGKIRAQRVGRPLLVSEDGIKEFLLNKGIVVEG